MNRIIIIIEGGTLQSVFSSNSNVSIELIDLDNEGLGELIANECAWESNEEYEEFVRNFDGDQYIAERIKGLSEVF